jgi:hypothetical protein
LSHPENIGVPDGAIVAANSEACQISGMTEEERARTGDLRGSSITNEKTVQFFQARYRLHYSRVKMGR